LTMDLLTVPLVAETQQAGRVYRVGFVSVSRGPGPTRST
jgi:hypothetical protein